MNNNITTVSKKVKKNYSEKASGKPRVALINS